MLPKFRTRPLYAGYTIPQLAVIGVFCAIYFVVFANLVEYLGIFKTLALGVIIIGVPAAILRVLNLNPEIHVMGWIYFKFIKPDIYLPGKRGGYDV